MYRFRDGSGEGAGNPKSKFCLVLIIKLFITWIEVVEKKKFWPFALGIFAVHKTGYQETHCL